MFKNQVLFFKIDSGLAYQDNIALNYSSWNMTQLLIQMNKMEVYIWGGIELLFFSNPLSFSLHSFTVKVS